MTEEFPAHQIKMVVIDIDGTLLDQHKQIAPRTLAAVRAARDAGLTVTLATARRYRNTRPIAEKLGIAIPLILCDGALIIDHPQNKVLHTFPLQAEFARQAAEIIAGRNIQPMIQLISGNVEETWIGDPSFDNPSLLPYLEAFPDNVRRINADVLCSVDLPDPLRVVAFALESEVRALTEDVAVLPCASYMIARGSYACAELTVMRQGCSKAAGVRALADLLDIDLSQVMAIGDSVNDLEMLQCVGWGVAMGQAAPVIKASARAVTASNAEDGVALAIERYALAQCRA